jgi:hypothetical protein
VNIYPAQPNQAANLNHLQGTQDKPAGTLPALRPDATHAKPNAGKGSAKYGRYVGDSILGKKLHRSFKIVGSYHHCWELSSSHLLYI